MGNIALNKPMTANNSILPYIPSRAVDGALAPSNRWVSDSIPAWMEVNPGALYMVNRWVVKHPSIITSPNNVWSNSNYANVDYKLQGSNDNSAWYDIDGVTNNSATSTDRSFNTVAYRFYRVYVSKGLRGNTGTTSIIEFELYQAYSAQLTNLAISSGTLTPVFNPNTLAYTATVDANVASINVTPTAQDPQAVVKVNGVVVTSGQPKAVALVYGSNTITVNVTDGSGAQKNYVITVTRPGSARLSTLTLQSSTANVPLSPSFAPATIGYTASVAGTVSTVTVTPTVEDPAATVKVNTVPVTSGQPSRSITLATGSGNNISIEVTATNGTKQTYTIQVTRVSGTSALLTNITLKAGKTTPLLAPGFSSTHFDYTTATTASPVAITITKDDPLATLYVTCNQVEITSTTTTYNASVNTGSNTVVIRVTSTSGDVKNYTIIITKS